MTRNECLELFRRLPFDGFVALDESGAVLRFVPPSGLEPDDEIAGCEGRPISAFAKLQNHFGNDVPDWADVLQQGVPNGTSLMVGRHRLSLKSGPTVFRHPEGGTTIILTFDRSGERYYQLLHRIKGHFHLLLGYFHLRERELEANRPESAAFLDARAVTAVVSALGEAYRQANGETLHILPSSVFLPLFESFSGRWPIVSSKSTSPEKPTPVRFVEKLALWTHQILVLAFGQNPSSPAHFEWNNSDNGVIVSFACENVNWNAVLNDESASGELARAYLTDLSGLATVDGDRITARFPPPAPFLAKI